jgi:hypothetical protein
MLVTRPKVGRTAAVVLLSIAGCKLLELGVAPAVSEEGVALLVGAGAAAAVAELAGAEGLDLREVLLVKAAAPLSLGPASTECSKFMLCIGPCKQGTRDHNTVPRPLQL